MPTLLSDDLLAGVMAAGQADVLVGLPTFNNAKTAGSVARAVLAAFSGPLVRQRTVLLNLDGDSTDGTREAVQSAAIEPAGLMSGQYALRTIHRIIAPYHGVPGRSTALRTVLAVAELMRARVVVLLEPTAAAMTVDDVVRWTRPVLAGGADYVKPALPRGPGEGPLITQIVRPLFRAACGVRLLEPLDTQLACSGRFAIDALKAGFWAEPEAEVGLDAFLTAQALTSRIRIAQVSTAAVAHVEAERRPGTAELFQQVMGSVFAALAGRFSSWAPLVGSEPVSTEGSVPTAIDGHGRFDLSSFAEAYRVGLDALAPLLASVLEPSVLETLQIAGRAAALVVNDTLWAKVVLAFQAAAIRKTASPRELAQMLEPLYLGRVASFLTETAATDDRDRLESLALAFEEQKPAVVAALRSQEEDNGTRHTGEIAGSA